MNTKDKLDRCIEIEHEVDTMPIPKLGVDSVEDCDDLYQAKLEYQWWLQEMKDEYEELNVGLGLVNRRLFPVSKRRI